MKKILLVISVVMIMALSFGCKAEAKTLKEMKHEMQMIMQFIELNKEELDKLRETGKDVHIEYFLYDSTYMDADRIYVEVTNEYGAYVGYTYGAHTLGLEHWSNCVY